MADQVPGRRRQQSQVPVSDEAMNEAKKAQEHLNNFFQKVSEQGMTPVAGNIQDQSIIKDLEQQIKRLKDEVGSFEKRWNAAESQRNEAESQLQEKTKAFQESLDSMRNQYLQHISKLDNIVKKSQQDIEDRDRTIMSLGNDLQSISKEHNDLKSRFRKLTDQNPDIADLSDPNRAMKLSEKFGALYDDAWTDAFEHLTGKQRQNPRDAIQFLLERLKDCRDMCKKVADTWMDSLQNVFLHPVQDTEAMSKMQGGKVQLRIGSKEQRLIRDVCRKVAPTVGVLVKQYFITQMKTHKLTDGCLMYLEGVLTFVG